MEGLNSALQAAKRQTKGYKIRHFRTTAYLLTGKIDFSKINANCLLTWNSKEPVLFWGIEKRGTNWDITAQV